MATSKKKQGFRKIVVKNLHFNWKFSGGIAVRPEINKNNKLFVYYGWFDHWLYVGDNENMPPDFKPQIVTLNFIRKSIEFALETGWNIENKTGLLEIEYKANKYRFKQRR